MKRILLIFLVVFCNSVFGQLIVDNTTQTPAQLVQNVLLGGGITVSNITFNGAAANATMVRDQVGFFTNGVTTNLGINEGIILSTGRATEAIGPNNSGSTTQASIFPMGGDPDLAAIATGAINTKAILEFDFVPIGNTLSFNFVFGSEEYLEYVGSSFNDVFGFFLSGPGITGPYTGGAANIALVPSTTTAISINNVNATSFPAFYVNNGTGATPAANPTIQFDGFTTVIAAQANVQCGMTYHIKLAISNVGDSAFDSAVFLQAQSFNTNAFSFPNDFLVSNGFAPCDGSTATICTGLSATIPHTWTFNGVPMPAETGPCITVSQPGVYCATAYPYGPGCPISDCITVEFLPPLPINPPDNLVECTNTVDLTQNTSQVLGSLSPSLFDVNYFTNLTDAENYASNILVPTAYTLTSNPQTIYIRVDDSSGSNCFSIQSFTVTVDPVTCLAYANQPPNLEQCDDASNDGIGTFDFSPQTPITLGAQNPADYTVTYHLTLAGAQGDTGAITSITNFQNTVNPQTIYIRVEDNTDPTFYATNSFQLIVHPQPATPNPSDVTVCDSYILPALPTGQTYHSASGGSATTLISAGTSISTSQTIYVFAQSGTTPNCTAEGDFVVTINSTPTAPNPSDVTVCDSYVLPVLPVGQTYHSASGGSLATLLPVGTSITTTQTIYVFAQTGTTPNCTSEGDFVVTVNTTPAVPNPSDVTVCGSYILPVLPSGQTYHSATGGSLATQIASGTSITTTQTIYIFSQTGTTPNCTSEGDFVVTVNISPTTPNPSDVTACDSYVLPALPAGQSYHTASGGTGTTLSAGTSITSSQTIYVYAQTGTT
ncbi:choice-of-anchor L domain-containing protein, partial [Flavobacterium sp.]|uniref:choice-of-anchor L domain-containing protein n=1 Tax=Flavobacterium sp. TaxID=239 RepID=UPI002601E367